MLIAQRPQPGEELRLRQDHPHVGRNRLHNDGRHFLSQACHCRLDFLQVVIRQGKGGLRNLFGHPRAPGDSKGRQTRPGFDQQAVTMTMIAAIKLNDALAAGITPGQPNGAHGGFGS